MTFSIGIAQNEDDRMSVFRQRYSAYVREGAIGERAEGYFTDPYDGLATSILLMCLFEGKVVGSLRFSVEPPNAAMVGCPSSCPEFEIFSDTLHALRQDGSAISSGSRFAIDREFQQRQKAALLIMIAQVRAARALGARWGIATARGAHLHFYRRLLLMEPVAEARRMPGLNYD